MIMMSYSSKEGKALRWAQSCRQYKLGGEVKRKHSVFWGGQQLRGTGSEGIGCKADRQEEEGVINSRLHALHAYNEQGTC